MMTRCVFRAGFVWRVIDNKWPGFEEAFSNFNPLAIAHYSDEKLEELGKDTRIVRNFTKILSRCATMRPMCWTNSTATAASANLLPSGPRLTLSALWLELKKNGSRLGGNSGPGMLRSMGKDTFLLTKDVSDALVNPGLMKKFSPTAQRDLRLVEQVFADLREQSGRSLCELESDSRVYCLELKEFGIEESSLSLLVRFPRHDLYLKSKCEFYSRLEGKSLHSECILLNRWCYDARVILRGGQFLLA